MTARPFDRASRTRWSDCIPETAALRPDAAAHVVRRPRVGEGIGPEIVPAALEVLDAVAGVTGRHFDVRVVETPGARHGTPDCRRTSRPSARRCSLRAAPCSAARSADASSTTSGRGSTCTARSCRCGPSPALSRRDDRRPRAARWGRRADRARERRRALLAASSAVATAGASRFRSAPTTHRRSIASSTPRPRSPRAASAASPSS